MTIKKMFSFRGCWMGISALWILLFHSDFFFTSPIVTTLMDYGYGGVDIFVFASGFGNYLSYLRDSSPLQFMKRRLSKLSLTYLPFVTLYTVVITLLDTNSSFSLIQTIGNIFGVRGLLSLDSSFWFVTGIVFCYLLTPYFADFIQNRTTASDCLLVLFLFLLSVSFWGNDVLLIIFSRLPVYTVGMIFSKNSSVTLNRFHIIGLSAGFLLGCGCLVVFTKYLPDYMGAYGLCWYPFILIVPFLCFLCSAVFQFLEQQKILKLIVSFFKFLGKYTLEIYLVHCTVFWIIYTVPVFHSVGRRNLMWLIASMLSVLFAISFRELILLLQKLLGNFKAKKQPSVIK